MLEFTLQRVRRAPYGFANRLSRMIEYAVMQVTVQLPDEIAQQLGDDREMSRRLLEAIVLEQYRLHKISQGKLAEVLGLSRWEAEEFLDQHNARHPYTEEMLEEDRRTLAKLPQA